MTRLSGMERGEKEKVLRFDDGGLPRRLLHLGGGVAGGGMESKAGWEERKKATSRGFVHKSSTVRPVPNVRIMCRNCTNTILKQLYILKIHPMVD